MKNLKEYLNESLEMNLPTIEDLSVMSDKDLIKKCEDLESVIRFLAENAKSIGKVLDDKAGEYKDDIENPLYQGLDYHSELFNYIGEQLDIKHINEIEKQTH